MAIRRSDTKHWAVIQVRRPKVSRAWGRPTKTHVYYRVVATAQEASEVLKELRRFLDRRDSVMSRRTTKPITTGERWGKPAWHERKKGERI